MQTTTWCQKKELRSDSSEVQCANRAKLEANIWQQLISENIEQ